MRTVAYIRVSTNKQECLNQKRAIEVFARQHGWEIARVYQDVASGASNNREAFGRLMANAAKGKFGRILFWSLDRISRRGIAETLRQSGVEYHSMQETWLNSEGPMTELLLAIMAWCARQERERLRERTRAGLARAVAQGKRLGRPEKVSVHANKARELHAGGASKREIARQLGVSRPSVDKLLGIS